ncbi:hypothetical protein H8E65_09650 [Candidatus Bathyarchaeota archaeon]|nr:hypothetical protein [Candidatus Bathyarchaeota archaeon]
MDAEILGLLAGSLVSLGAYSVLIGDNPFSKITENIYMGILGGYIFVTNWDFIQKNAIGKLMNGDLVYIIALVLALMLLGRLKPKYLWVSRYPVVVTVGVGLGMAMRTTVTADFLGQIQATLLPWNSLNNIVMVIGTITAAAYFIFTAQKSGVYKYVNTAGRVFLLCAFGVAYGQTVSFRMELVIGRLVAMLDPRVAMYTYAFILIIAVALAYGYKTKKIEWYSGR